jgi:hypothetical protein
MLVSRSSLLVFRYYKRLLVMSSERRETSFTLRPLPARLWRGGFIFFPI